MPGGREFDDADALNVLVSEHFVDGRLLREIEAMQADTTLRLDADLLPESLKAEEIVVVAQNPTVDVGSSNTGANISSDFVKRAPVIRPGALGGSVRSFEA